MDFEHRKWNVEVYSIELGHAVSKCQLIKQNSSFDFFYRIRSRRNDIKLHFQLHTRVGR